MIMISEQIARFPWRGLHAALRKATGDTEINSGDVSDKTVQ